MRFCRVSVCLLGAVLTALAATTASFGQVPTEDARISALIESLGKARTPNSVELSPDGGSVAWTVRGQHGSELHLTGITPAGEPTGAPERVISPDTAGDAANNHAGTCNASNPAWSPDGKQLAFLSDCEASGDGWMSTKQADIF